MADSIRTENIRQEQSRLQLEQQNDKAVKDLREKNKNDIQRVVEQNQRVKEDLSQAYEVQLSMARDEYEKKLTETRAQNDRTIKNEKMQGEEEVERIRARYQEQIARYRENSQKALDDIRKETDMSANNLKSRAKSKGSA